MVQLRPSNRLSMNYLNTLEWNCFLIIQLENSKSLSSLRWTIIIHNTWVIFIFYSVFDLSSCKKMIDLCTFSSLLFCGHFLNENFLSFISQVGVAGECAQAHAGSMLLAFFIIFVIIKIMPPSDDGGIQNPFSRFTWTSLYWNKLL